jgi:integrase
MCGDHPTLAGFANDFESIMKNRYADSTKLSYRSAFSNFFKFADEFKLSSDPISFANVASQHVWVAFLLWLRRRNVKYDSARKYLSAIRSVLKSYGIDIPFPEMALLDSVRKGWRRGEGPPAKKSPIRRDQVDAIFEADKTIFATATLIGFEALARLGELINLRWRNVDVRAEIVLLHLERAKTDPFGVEGQFLSVSRLTWEKAMKRMKSGKSSSRVFPFTKTQFSKWIAQHGLTGHSLRRGGGQFMYDRGFPLEQIKQKGRWRSNAVFRYLDMSSTSIVF